LTEVDVGPPIGSDINRLDARGAMGLPEQYVGPDRSAVRAQCRRLASCSPGRLAELAEDTSLPFAERFGAGLLLGLVGDPRIDPLRPAMCEVPAGVYPVGLPFSEIDRVVEQFSRYGVLREWIEKESPQHDVELKTFRIGKYPVTNGEYQRFLLETGYLPLPTSWPFGVSPPGTDNLPVFTIAPSSAERYCEWLSGKTGRQFRLPSEAEWEAAAAGPEGRAFPWGDSFMPDHANTVESGVLTATPVGIFPQGRAHCGALDLAGNVEEYVSDDYRPYPGGDHVMDDLHPATGGYRIARGGSFTRYRDLARCQRRHGWYEKPIYAMGFRLAESRTPTAPAIAASESDAEGGGRC
jgi:formylglycine-generating enzyme required for sulfatase activity